MTTGANKVLVTGGSGFLGRALIRHLVDDGRDVVLTTRKNGYQCPGATVLAGDIADTAFSRKALEGVSIVYYLAGEKKNLKHHTERPYDFVRGNTEPLLGFLNAVRDSAVLKIVYVSSTQVIDRDWEREKDGYAMGKYLNEIVLRSFAQQQQIPAVIVRPPGIYGPGDSFDPETANFIPSMIGKIFEGGDELPVWGSGQRMMQYIFVDDLAANLCAAEDETVEGTLLVGNHEAKTVNEIAEEIIRLSGKTMRIHNDTSKPDQPSRLFDFNNPVPPAVGFSEGLKRTVAYYREQYDK